MPVRIRPSGVRRTVELVELLIATWQAGGGTQVALELGRLLGRRGHRVPILGPAADAGRIEAAGCIARAIPKEAEFDPVLGRRGEDQPETMARLFYGQEIADAFAAELERDTADGVVVDYLLRSVSAAAERAGVLSALLIHTIYGFHGGAGDDEETRRRWYQPVDICRLQLGLDPLPASTDSVTVALVRRAACALVAAPREFDDWVDPPENVIHVGPLSPPAADGEWQLPWPIDDTRPLIVVTLGTTYMAHEAVLTEIAHALDPSVYRVLLLTGNELAPEEIAAPDGVEVRGYVPHDRVMVEAALAITHAGTGTLLAAFAAGVPVVAVPLGRDQPANARRTVELGLGSSLSPQATRAEIRALVTATLADDTIRARVDSLARAIHGYANGSRAVNAIEQLSGT
jgi:UDP:flavonoid glycosyltransferase YjiC (YdhE family)